MKLNISQIRGITTGANRVEEKDGNIHFYRFTKQQEELYKERKLSFYQKTFASSGIQLRFRTNSQSIYLDFDVIAASSRCYFSLEVFVNGEKIGDIKNFNESELSGNYTKNKFSVGNFSKKFYIGFGEKDVCIYLPWSVETILKEFTIDDNSFIEPIKPSKKMLAFGDSITHGYDALYPSNKYITKLANMLDAEEYNKAIGGEIFFPALANEREDFEPDYIIVAYGTNDWSKCNKEDFIHNCKQFLYNVSSNYKNAKIFAITPIWRKDMNESRPSGDFRCAEEIIEKQAEGLENVSVIKGFGFVPQNEEMFADLRLHPNDKGFGHYFDNLAKQIKEILHN